MSSFKIMENAKMAGAQRRAEDIYSAFIEAWEKGKYNLEQYGKKKANLDFAADMITTIGSMFIPGAGAAATMGEKALMAGAKTVGKKGIGNFLGDTLNQVFGNKAPDMPTLDMSGLTGYYGSKAKRPYELKTAGMDAEWERLLASVEGDPSDSWWLHAGTSAREEDLLPYLRELLAGGKGYTQGSAGSFDFMNNIA